MALLEEIRGIRQEVAEALESAECRTDSDIRALTQQDLQELLPGLSNFKTRKKIFEAIHKRRSIHVILNELKQFVPDQSLKDALNSNGALHEYLQVLKELKVEINHVQGFLDAHIDLLEKFCQNQHTKNDEDQSLVPSGNQASAASSAKEATIHSMEQMYNLYHEKSPNTSHMEQHVHAQKPQARSCPFGRLNSEPQRRPNNQATVTYKMVVSGNTLNCHLDMMRKIKSDVNGSFNLEASKSDEDCQVIIIFCPIASRPGTDVAMALKDISVNKPVIIVMMHHSRHAQTHPTVKSPHHNVILVVNVFFHDSVHGLLTCDPNDAAIVAIQTKLQAFVGKT